MTAPDRLAPLIAKLEAGEQPTPDDFLRARRLQALDLAQLGQQFIQDQETANDDAYNFVAGLDP